MFLQLQPVQVRIVSIIATRYGLQTLPNGLLAHPGIYGKLLSAVAFLNKNTCLQCLMGSSPTHLGLQRSLRGPEILLDVHRHSNDIDVKYPYIDKMHRRFNRCSRSVRRKRRPLRVAHRLPSLSPPEGTAYRTPHRTPQAAPGL